MGNNDPYGEPCYYQPFVPDSDPHAQNGHRIESHNRFDPRLRCKQPSRVPGNSNNTRRTYPR